MLARLKRYIEADDPYVAAANFIAMLLAWNQPFYPLYLWFIIGADAWIGMPEIGSGVLNALIPALTRRRPLMGRMALCLLALGNTVLCMKLMGQTSGVALFLPACAMLSAILFHWRERWVMVPLAAMPLLVWLLVVPRLGASPVVFAPDEARSLFTMNAVTIGVLLVILGWAGAGIHRDRDV